MWEHICIARIMNCILWITISHKKNWKVWKITLFTWIFLFHKLLYTFFFLFLFSSPPIAGITAFWIRNYVISFCSISKPLYCFILHVPSASWQLIMYLTSSLPYTKARVKNLAMRFNFSCLLTLYWHVSLVSSVTVIILGLYCNAFVTFKKPWQPSVS